MKAARDSEFSNWYHVGVRQWDYEGWCDTKANRLLDHCWEGHMRQRST